MTDVIAAARLVHEILTVLGFEHCFIGGIAVQHWGEPRVTRDVDLVVLTHFDDEAAKVDKLIDAFRVRRPDTREHALLNRVLLLETEDGIGIDIGLGGFQYEIDALSRSVEARFDDQTIIPIICAEDLIAMKVFAGRTQDWFDVRGVLVRQMSLLNWVLIESNLTPLLEILEMPERINELMALKESVAADMA